MSSSFQVSPSGLAALTPDDRASFATTARLLSCLVTESMVDAVYFPLEGFEAKGFALVTVPAEPHDVDIDDRLLALILLSNVPILKPDPRRTIVLLDPLDMLPQVFEFPRHDVENDARAEHADLFANISDTLQKEGSSTYVLSLRRETPAKALSIWELYARIRNLRGDLIAEIQDELASSIAWQSHSFANPPDTPEFVSSSIVWEQSIVEGHPTHPMHKTRRFLPPIPNFHPGKYDLKTPNLRFIAIDEKQLNITGEFDGHLRPLIHSVEKSAGMPLPVPTGCAVVPVHELQVAHIEDKFPEAIIFPDVFSIPLQAQQSLRSVIVPDVYQDLSLKLGVGIKLTSAVRTISPPSAFFGPRFSSRIVPSLSMDPTVVTVAKELASVVHKHPDDDIAKHCAAIIREAHEINSEARGERLIVCTALVESGHAGPSGHIPAVIRVFDLDTQDKRIAWLKRYIDVYFRAFLPSMLENGVAFECHPQNCLARFDIHTRELLGFIVRDFGGMRVHRETLKNSTGLDVEVSPNHSIIAQTIEDVYTRMYHTMFHNHLQQLIRVLGLHYNGVGWALVREQLEQSIPQGHGLRSVWLSPDSQYLPGKCFMRMRIQGMFRHHLHSPFPNLIHYKGTGTQ